MTTSQRIGPDLPETVIELDADSGRLTPGLTRHEADVAEIETAILAFLQGSAEARKEEDIRQSVEGRTTLKAEALRALVGRGQVARTGGGRRNDPFLYFLVPTYLPGQENKKPMPTGIVDKQGSNSCSREMATTGKSTDLWEQETGGELVEEEL